MVIQKFLTWLGEDSTRNGVANPFPDNSDESSQSVSPKTPAQAAPRRSPPSPQRLMQIAAEYDVRQLQESSEQYEAFLAEGCANFMQWVESLLEKSAACGGRLLLLTFDNSTGIVSAAAPGLREILAPISFALSISQAALPRLAVAVANHFQQANFHVESSRRESTCSRSGTQFTPAYDCVDIFWMEGRVRCGNSDDFVSQLPDPSLENPQVSGTSERDGTRSYQTAPLPEYLSAFQEKALELFRKVKECVGEARTKSSKGSFSVVSSAGHHTVAKIIIFENGLGKANGDLRDLSDGVYVLVRASGTVGDRIWNSEFRTLSGMNRNRTIGIAPKHLERFAYILVAEQDSDEEIVNMIQDCVKAADSVSRA